YGTIDAGMPDREGASVFYQDSSGTVFHTYSCYARGIDMLNGTYHILDLMPKGRDEDPDDPQTWVRYHDRYQDCAGRAVGSGPAPGNRRAAVSRQRGGDRPLVPLQGRRDGDARRLDPVDGLDVDAG